MRKLIVSLVLLAALPRPSRAQNYPGAHPNITTVAVVDHQRDEYNFPDDRIALVHLDRNGARFDLFNDNGSGGWSGLQSPTPSGPWAPVRSNSSLAAVADRDYGGSSIFWFPATDGALNAEFPFFADEPSFWFNDSPVPLTYPSMFPMSAISYVQPDGMPRGSVFGLGGDGHSLRELWLYENQWNFYDHGAPSSAQLYLAPGSAVATAAIVGTADVLVALADSDGNVWMHSTLNNHGWTGWQSLGSFGSGNARIPIMVAHAYNGTTRVHVFLPIRNRYRYWQLWEIYGDRGPNGYTWSTWRSYPGPSGLYGNGAFELTAGVVWHPHGVLHIDLFGTSDFGFLDANHCVGGQVVMFAWDGATWGWSPTNVTPSGCDAFQTMSAVAIDSGVTERGSVFFENSVGSPFELSSSDGNRDLATWQKQQL
jgi:hypothetical protein